MFDKVLIANRGEIAVRVIRACKEMGIRTLAVYSEPDVDSLHVQLADEAICIGSAAPADSYLKMDRILSAAEIGDVEAIHPGYGFLAESPQFAEACEKCNIRFIGPTAEHMRLMGDKAKARETVQRAGVPVVPGSDGLVYGEEHAVGVARELGYPVIIKATAGGGGRGMRLAHNDASLLLAFRMAQREAEQAFGNSGLYVEKALEEPRHIEFQVLGDGFGTIIHLGERDCSIQRRHQKLIEEAPSPALSPDLRKKMGRAAVRIARAVGYLNAGTVEFLLDQQGKFYFIEMNTRIQVEHPVTEAITNIDLVKEQVRIAAGDKLGYDQRSIRFCGHAIECRINAEDPAHRFLPSPGRIGLFSVPGGPRVRVDSHVYGGYSVPPYYDSLLAKLIASGADRREALRTCLRALDEFFVEGIPTTIPFARSVLSDPNFEQGRYSTRFVDELLRAQSEPAVREESRSA